MSFFKGMKDSSLGGKASSKVRRRAGETLMSSVGMSRSPSKSMRSQTQSMIVSSVSNIEIPWPTKSNRASEMAVASPGPFL